MNSRTSSPKTPQRNHSSCKHGSLSINKSPVFQDGPGCCSTPSSASKKRGSFSHKRTLWDAGTPPGKHLGHVSSPISKKRDSPHDRRSFGNSQSLIKESDVESSASCVKNLSSSDPSWSKTFSSTDTNGTVRVDLDFPHGGWDEDSSDESSSCSLEIVESEADCSVSPCQRGRKRKQTEVLEEDNAILSGMGEEIERQLEAKAERNRLTVPNVKNILRSVITNPYVQAMVRRSIKSGDVAVSGDTDDLCYEPRMTRAKAKLLCDQEPDVQWPKLSEMSWAGTPQKTFQSSECQALIGGELHDDSDDDDEYQPCEDEPSDNDYSERDGSERGSERDISAEQSPAFFDTDTESFSTTPTPSPKPNIIDSATQTNWSEDGVFKVPLIPPEPQIDQNKDENIALRTRSKLPLNDTPLEEIEQAFVPPDITPDLYDTACDNADWQEFLKEFMQPMRSEPEVQNHDDEEEDPEYNVLADEEIIDKEELRRDRAVKVSKRELNELMRELMEFTENMSSEDEDGDKKEKDGNSNSCNEEMSLFLDAYMSLGTLTPLNPCKTTPPPPRSPSTSSLNTPVPPVSPPCSRTPATGKKLPQEDMNHGIDESSVLHCNGQDSHSISTGKSNPPFSSGHKTFSTYTPVKVNFFPFLGPGNQDSSPQTFKDVNEKSNPLVENGACSMPYTQSNTDIQYFSPGKEYYFQSTMNGWEKTDACATGPPPPPSEVQNLAENAWSNSNVQQIENATVPTELDDASISDAESSVSLPLTSSSHPSEDDDATSEQHAFSKLMLYQPSGTVSLSPQGDVIADDAVLLSATQRLVLDQQMRQLVQFLTQSFLQTYQHPTHGKYAPLCKDRLVYLQSMAREKEKSAFKPANLLPSMEVVKSWEDTLAGDEGAEIESFMKKQVELSKRYKNRHSRYQEKFPPQLMSLMAGSTAFIYPHLIPALPFRNISEQKMFLLSEDHLLALGLEEFTEFIKANNPKHRGGCLRWAMTYVVEYLLVGRKANLLNYYVRRKRSQKGNPLEYYFQHNVAPPTSHVVLPFSEQKMARLKHHPHFSLPAVWRDFLYPARTSNE